MILPLDLGDRLLWADGVSTVEPGRVPELLLQSVPPEKIAVTETSGDVEQFNRFSPVKIGTKESYNEAIFPPRWTLPETINNLDLDEYLTGLVDRIEHDAQYEERVERLLNEICLFKQLQLDIVLRALIYVIETMTEKNVVWGVGRGSSCSSYLLYLLGLHEVDCVKYGIEISDFLRPQEN